MKKKCNRLIGVGLWTIITTSSILGVNSFADIKDITGPLPVITETTITKEDKTTTETTKVVTTERTTEATTESKTTERTTKNHHIKTKKKDKHTHLWITKKNI